MRGRATIFLATIGAVLVVAVPHASADAQDVARRVAQEIISPFCPGVTLHDCPSSEADEMRREILALAETGMSSDEIIDLLVEERGEEILAEPSNPLAWTLPAVLVVLGAGVAIFLMTRWSRRRRAEPVAEGLNDVDRNRVRAEVKRMRER
ncbi:MAG: hypothetical protein GEU71_08300 [Actinobacteria bacterium]|nr:hypothetical protein [Actinomycetota bacterium]